MRTPFYNTPERQRALIAEAQSWLGTPFRENSALKGLHGGTDCACWENKLHSTLGAFPELALPVLPIEVVRHHHEYSAHSLVLEWLRGPLLRSRVLPLSKDTPPMVGDIVVFRQKQSEHHIGVWCGAEIIHVARHAGVVSRSSRDPKFVELITGYFRIYEQ